MNTFAFGRKYGAAFMAVLLLLLGAILTSAQTADAQEIVNFTANPVDALVPGTELTFRLEGTPQARASVSINGIRQPISLRETSAGFYEGSYTISTNDRLPSNPAVQATLRQGNRATSARLGQPLASMAQAPASAPASAPAIQRFTMAPDRIVPGTELVFSLQGTPNGQAAFTIRDVVRSVDMVETQPGVYEGRYTVRRQDEFAAPNVSATLKANGQVARARMGEATRQTAQGREPRSRESEWGAQPSGASAQRDFSLEITSPSNMSQVGGGPIEVHGRSTPHSPLNVLVEATTSMGGVIGINQNVLKRTITSDEQGRFAFTFEPRFTVPGTRYEVSVTGTRAGEEKSRTLTLVQR